jgi:hypothetical protein
MFSVLAAFGQLVGQVKSVPASGQPVVLVQRLYTDVVSRQPIGVTNGADMTIFAPYLSKTLRHRIDLTAACEGDYFR